MENEEKKTEAGKTVKVYSTPSCPYCHMAKKFLDDKGISYEDIDVASDEAAAKEMVEKSGQMGVPVIMIDDLIIVGFDKDEAVKALELE
ncbi:MAG: glutaredoxin domain-containing protein [Patescibacteria group bacterium]|nr:glutaredoxin domain-containing protein [Patescibacteria group bacterium]